MGAMVCSRKDCNSGCADYHSDEYGYLCYNCFEELDSLEDNTDPDTIKKFMKSKPNQATELGQIFRKLW